MPFRCRWHIPNFRLSITTLTSRALWGGKWTLNFFRGSRGKNGKCFSLAQPIEQKLYFSSFEDDAFAPVVYRGEVVILSTQYCKRRNFFAALFTWKIGIKGEDQLYSSLSPCYNWVSGTHSWLDKCRPMLGRSTQNVSYLWRKIENSKPGRTTHWLDCFIALLKPAFVTAKLSPNLKWVQ